MAQLPDTKKLQQLARKFLQGIISDSEQQELNDWFQSQQGLEKNSKPIELSEDEHRKLIFARIQGEIQKTSQQNIFKLWPRIAVAASIVLALSAGGYFLLHKQPPQQFTQIHKQDIAPGRNRATLTLANGQKIILTKGSSGKLAQQGNTLVKVNGGNAIAYIPPASGNNVLAEMQYNTLSTIRGEESPFPLVLADGTRVWLNAASSITYPVAFNGKYRLVKITGEVLFEVAHNAAKPFKVIANGQTIEDIGTIFNINTYNDEPVISTTLVEGSIKLSNSSGSTILKPGQQAIVTPSTQSIKLQEADIEEVLAWRNGNFVFNHENIRSIMRKISRWYDVDVEYQDGVSDDWVGGSESRFTNVSEVLRKLEMTGQFHFKIEGKKITVTK